MSWRDNLQPASFRGVPFFWQDTSGNVGRRVEVHEYTKRDNHWAEDLGLSTAKPLRLRAFVLGANYMAERDQLIEALNKSGPGTLVHPRRGAMQVIALDESTWTESTREGGMASFDLVFVLAGKQELPAVQADTVSAVTQAVNSGLTAVQNDFEDKFKVTGFAAYVLDTAQQWYQTGLDVLGKYGQYTGIATRFLLTLSGMKDSFLSLIRTPKILAENMIDAFRDLVGESTDIQTPLAIQSEMVATMNNIETVVTTTQARQQQAANRAALIELYSIAASLLTIQSIAEQSQNLAVQSNVDSPFDSYNQAIAIRDQLTTELDVLAETASDELYVAIRDVQAAFSRHIEAHGFQLQRIASYTAHISLPALVAAHTLYGDASREADIVRRNNIEYPNFIPSGIPLEVLDA